MDKTLVTYQECRGWARNRAESPSEERMTKACLTMTVPTEEGPRWVFAVPNATSPTLVTTTTMRRTIITTITTTITTTSPKTMYHPRAILRPSMGDHRVYLRVGRVSPCIITTTFKARHTITTTTITPRDQTSSYLCLLQVFLSSFTISNLSWKKLPNSHVDILDHTCMKQPRPCPSQTHRWMTSLVMRLIRKDCPGLKSIPSTALLRLECPGFT
jgi:hypothetical protein